MSDEQNTDAPKGKSPWEDLKRMADEVKVKLHLAGMEAKDRWKALEPKIQELQTKVEAKGEQAADTVQTQLTSVVDSLRRFVDDLRADLDVGKKKDATPAAEIPPPDKTPDTSG